MSYQALIFYNHRYLHRIWKPNLIWRQDNFPGAGREWTPDWLRILHHWEVYSDSNARKHCHLSHRAATNELGMNINAIWMQSQWKGYYRDSFLLGRFKHMFNFYPISSSISHVVTCILTQKKYSLILLLAQQNIWFYCSKDLHNMLQLQTLSTNP